MKTVQRLLLLWLTGLLLNVSFAATQVEMLDPELRELHARGCAVYHGKHDREGGLALFKELETRATEKNNLYWLGSALWKQAQVFSDDGNQAGSIALFEKSLASSSRDPDFAGTANHLLLLGNLFTNYENRGQRGESLRIHQAMIPATGLNLMRTSKLPADTPLFDLPEEQLAQLKNMAFISILYATEIRLRFESGNDAGALALAEKIDRRLAGTTRPREVTIYAGILETLAKLHLAAGRTAEAEQVLIRLIDLQKIPKSEAFDEILAARIDLALLRCKQGAEPAPLLADALAAIASAEEKRWPQRRLVGTGKIARMKAHAGEFTAARLIMDAAVTETRTLDEPRLLAELLLTRAELRLDSGLWKGAQFDLFEALKWYRQQGGLRAETAAYVQYVRYLRMAGKTTEALATIARAKACLSNFPDTTLRAILNAEIPLVAALRDDTPPTVPETVVSIDPARASDLQPVELTTRISETWSAKGRFTLTNPGTVAETGWITAKGVALEAAWDADAFLWRVHAALAGTRVEVKQKITLQPLDQATIVLTVDPALAKDGDLQLTWTGQAGPQTAWWRYTQGKVEGDVAVIDANLAVENPFYSVPLHHYIVRMNPDAGGSQNLRVSTTQPCRVELVDAATGKVVAVDATGDGDFKGVGDVIFADGNLDGIPDLRFDKGQRVATLEIQLYPISRYDEVGVKLELQQRNGTWTVSATDRLIGKE
jgi:hypothetical protein